MESICVFNNKGGVGKTTLLCNMAASLSVHQNKKILIIDADPQCNATTYTLPESTVLEIYESPKKTNTIINLIEPFRRGKGNIPSELPIIESQGFHVDIIPGDPKLALADDFLARDWFDAISGGERGIRSTLFLLETLNKCQNYDFIIFDVGPSLGALNRAVLLVSDFFMVPMASDIFSLQALSNIRIALENWSEGMKDAIDRFSRHNKYSDLTDVNFSEKTKFIGYVTQQYTAKSVEGQRVPVKAYESIIKKIPKRVKTNLTDKFSKRIKNFSAKIGDVPYLQSMIPLSQTSHKPIFLLKSRDGVVGSHFAKVRDFDSFVADLSTKFIENLEAQR